MTDRRQTQGERVESGEPGDTRDSVPAERESPGDTPLGPDVPAPPGRDTGIAGTRDVGDAPNSGEVPPAESGEPEPPD